MGGARLETQWVLGPFVRQNYSLLAGLEEEWAAAWLGSAVYADGRGRGAVAAVWSEVRLSITPVAAGQCRISF